MLNICNFEVDLSKAVTDKPARPRKPKEEIRTYKLPWKRQQHLQAGKLL